MLGLRAGDQNQHQAVRGLCSLERSGEPRPPAAPKSFCLRLPRGDKSSRRGGRSPQPLRCASFPRPRLSQLSLASRGECDGRWAPSGSGLGGCIPRRKGQTLRAAPTPPCAGLCVKFSSSPASPGCRPWHLRESQLAMGRARSLPPPPGPSSAPTPPGAGAASFCLGHFDVHSWRGFRSPGRLPTSSPLLVLAGG